MSFYAVSDKLHDMLCEFIVEVGSDCKRGHFPAFYYVYSNNVPFKATD